ncbi:MAG: SusC/RagA family TonB-linked outer membrane protein [Pseudobacter sp.]|uniref:SusC/RagA family TonB-linked outer membrane protein n=1 Tax=Pseudobacter sp. TaxID=2045420 RepID=UPI003F802E99
MKLTAVFFLAAFLNVSATGFSQNVSYSGKNVPIEKVFVECKKQTGYSFLYPSSLLNIAFPVTIDAKEVPLEKFLQELFSGQPIGYEIRNRSILLFQKPLNPTPLSPKHVDNIRIYNLPETAFPVKIKVIDSLGQPLVRASVLVRNKKISVVTDAEGIAAIQAEIGDVIEISFVGYETFTHTVKDRNNVVFIRLKLSEKGMDEVVTGYTKLRKESFTGNSIRVTQEEILKVGNRNVISALQVFDPSFRLEVNNVMGSDPNTLPEFYIRGRSGIGVKSLDQTDLSEAVLKSNPNLPIFILDGYEISVERVYDYDITRIASVTILKDAAATAIYGSRAANGVVVLRTVAPIPGKLRVEYNVVGSLAIPDLSDYNLMNAEEKIRAEELAGFYIPNPVTGGQVVKELLEKKNQVARGVNTDWISQPLRNAWNGKHTLSFDGGFEQLRFSAMLKYDLEKGVMKGAQRQRKGAGLILDYRVGNLQIRNDFNYDAVNATESPYGSLSDYTTKNPYDEIYDENGRPLRTTRDWRFVASPFTLKNPIYEALTTENFSTNGYQSFTNNTGLVWRPFSKVTFRGDLMVGRNLKRSDAFTDPLSGTQVGSLGDPNMQGKLAITRTDEVILNSNLSANYVNNIGGHNMNFTTALNVRENRGTQVSEFYTGFPSGALRSPNYAAAMERKSTYVENIERLIGALVGLNYTYRDIYLLDLSGRVDGSSQFGSEKRFAPFWSVGTGINLHNYSFMKGNNIFNRLRITGSIGQTGKTGFSPYDAKGTYEIQQSRYTTGTGLLLKAMENPNLTWEITNKTDLVLDMGLFKNKLSINFNWYNQLTTDLVNDVDMPMSSGFLTYKDNVGKIRNRGFEINVRTDLFRTKKFYLNLYGRFSSNKNTLVELSNSLRRYNELVNQQYDGYANTSSVLGDPSIKVKYSTAHTKFVEGGSVTSIFGMRSLGINPADGKEIFMRPDGTITYIWSANDQVIIGDATPKGQGSFGFNAAYKDFTLSASFLYQFGAQEYNYTYLYKVENVDLYATNADRRVLDQRWLQPGNRTPLKDIAERNYITRPTSRFIQNNNYIRFNSLALTYNFDQRRVAKMGLTRLSVQLNTNNLATISTIRMERGLSSPFTRNFDFTIRAVF